MALNKTAFSLASLVVMLAFCCFTPAMAGEFGVTLSVDASVDVSSEDNIQVEETVGAPTTTEIMVTFAEVVNHAPTAIGAPTAATAVASGTSFGADDIQIIAYNEFGGTTTEVVFAIEGTNYSSVVDPSDGKHFTVTLSRGQDSGATKVLLFMAKHGVELADPRAALDAGARTVDGKSAEASLTIYYVRQEYIDGAPIVYSIRRAADPLLPVTSATADVIILLSEKPKAFTKDHVDVTNATWGDPVALEPIPEDRDGPDNQIVFNVPSPLNNDNVPSTGLNRGRQYAVSLCFDDYAEV